MPGESEGEGSPSAAQFGGLLLSVIVTFGALSFFNALALGPLAEHLSSGDWQAEPASAGLGHRAGG